MNQLVMRGLRTGAALAGAITTTMAISSALKSKSPWAGINAMATGIGVGGRRPSKSFDTTETAAGLGFLVGGMLVWGLGYEATLAATGRRSSVLTGAMSALSGYALDRWFLSEHLVPNFKKTMGTAGTIAKYATLGIVSAMASRISQGGLARSVTADSGQRSEGIGASMGDASAGAFGDRASAGDVGGMATPGTEAGAANPLETGVA